MCTFQAETSHNIVEEKLQMGQQIVLGGGFRDTERAVRVIKGHCEDWTLRSDHEEALDCCEMYSMQHVIIKGL